MPNWKEPGPDFVQGFRQKNLKNIQEGLRTNLQKSLENGNVSMWMTKGENHTNAVGQKKSRAASNYRPITCLPLVWKLLI